MATKRASARRFTGRTEPTKPDPDPTTPAEPEAPPEAQETAPTVVPESSPMFEAPEQPTIAVAQQGRKIVICIADQYEWPKVRDACLAADPTCQPTTKLPLLGLFAGDTLQAGFMLGFVNDPKLPRKPYITEPPIKVADHWTPSHDGLGGGSVNSASLLSLLGQQMIPHRGAYGAANTRIKDGILEISYG